MWNGYTYGAPVKARSELRYRCTQGCKARLYLTVDGQFVKNANGHNHPRPQYHLSDNVTFARSQRGGRLLVCEGYSYSLQTNKYELSQWRCTMVQPGTNKRCTAKLLTNERYNVLNVSGMFLWTKRGGKHPLLLLSGYTYSFQKQNADGRISWYCSRRLKGCRASAISFGTRAFTHKPHDHPPPKLPDNIGEKQFNSLPFPLDIL